MQPDHECKVTRGVEYVVHDGVRLTGDLYQPVGRASAPIVIAVHGGGWQASTAAQYKHWGLWLATRGIALFSIEYRLVKGRENLYPASVHDTRAAIQFVRANAARLSIDPERIGLMGSSAGGHLSSLVALAGDREPFVGACPDDPHCKVSTRVKTVVSVCSIYDMLAQWEHDIVSRPRDNICEKYLGVSAIDDKFAYFNSSPYAYITPDSDGPSFFIGWGTDDDVVDWKTQAEPFVRALKQADYRVRILPVVGAPHFFMYAPLDDPGCHSQFLAGNVFRFLQEQL
jgi:acetyl esterase/lipase